MYGINTKMGITYVAFMVNIFKIFCINYIYNKFLFTYFNYLI